MKQIINLEKYFDNNGDLTKLSGGAISIEVEKNTTAIELIENINKIIFLKYPNKYNILKQILSIDGVEIDNTFKFEEIKYQLKYFVVLQTT